MLSQAEALSRRWLAELASPSRAQGRDAVTIALPCTHWRRDSLGELQRMRNVMAGCPVMPLEISTMSKRIYVYDMFRVRAIRNQTSAELPLAKHAHLIVRLNYKCNRHCEPLEN